MTEFMTTALEFVRQRAKEALQTRQDEPLSAEQLVDLAAHFYALACVIPTETGSALLHEGVPRRPDSAVKVNLKQLSELSRDTAPSELYWDLIVTLQSIERSLINSTPTVAATTKLCSPPELGLCGEVVHWLRENSDWRWLRETREQLAGGGGPPRPAPHPADNLPRLAMHWNADRSKPRVVRFNEPADGRARLLDWLQDSDGKEKRQFRIALCPLLAECRPRFDIVDQRFFQAKRTSALAEWNTLKAHITTLLEAAEKEKIHLLVLPELLGDGQVEKLVLENFRAARSYWPLGIIAGSFHQWPYGGAKAERPPVNRAILWSRPGVMLLQHDKRGKFRVSRRQYKDAKRLFFAEGPDSLPDNVDTLVERIEHNRDFHVLDTVLGRFVMVICADCIAPDYTVLVPLILELRPDFVFVVAMTPETEVFEAFMKDLARRRIASFFVNAACMCRSSQLFAAVDLALHEPAGAPATRFHWRTTPEGQGKLKQRYYQPDIDDKKRWHEPETEDAGARLLRCDGYPIALLVDLAPHFAWVADELKEPT